MTVKVRTRCTEIPHWRNAKGLSPNAKTGNGTVEAGLDRARSLVAKKSVANSLFQKVYVGL